VDVVLIEAPFIYGIHNINEEMMWLFEGLIRWLDIIEAFKMCFENVSLSNCACQENKQ